MYCNHQKTGFCVKFPITNIFNRSTIYLFVSLQAGVGDVSSFLSLEKQRQSQIRAEHLRIRKQTEQYLREIELVQDPAPICL